METAGARLGEAGVRLTAVTSLLALVAASCAPAPLASPRPPEPLAATPAPAPPAATPARDSCGAAGLQDLIGRPRTEIPVPVYPDRERVACTTCPITQDYRPDRLDIFFDERTGIIRQIRCG
ncbi:MAG: peptidase inhibitor I78 [Alphaproteobacteria bacterium]|nr:peptidase inhibitor I78 [Alphaproteobacteria bacterium]